MVLQFLQFPEACNFIKKETLAQAFSCEFCEISKNTFFYRTALAAASVPVLRYSIALAGHIAKSRKLAVKAFFNILFLTHVIYYLEREN